MNKKEVAEIKKRFTKKNASFSRMAGCYVDMNHEKVCSFNGQFLTLPENEFHKYLEIAGKTLSGTMGNNLLNLSFLAGEEAAGGHQHALMALRESGLQNEEMLDAWYDMVIAQYKHVGNYLILLYLDAYDVPMRTKDGQKLDDSEEVYTYLLCAVCPVELTKAGLEYRREENCFAARDRDWVVGAPESGFLFPSFRGRSTDIHEALFYTRDAKLPHDEMMEKILGCSITHTAAEHKKAFSELLMDGLEGGAQPAEDLYLDVQKNLQDFVALDEDGPEDREPLLLDGDVVRKALREAQLPEEKTESLTAAVCEVFGQKPPLLEQVVDKNALKNNDVRLEKNRLQRLLADSLAETGALKEKTDQLQEEKQSLRAESEALRREKDSLQAEAARLREEAASEEEDSDYAVSVRIDDGKAAFIRTEYVDGERYLLIPLDHGETVLVNGEEAEV